MQRRTFMIQTGQVVTAAMLTPASLLKSDMRVKSIAQLGRSTVAAVVFLKACIWVSQLKAIVPGSLIFLKGPAVSHKRN